MLWANSRKINVIKKKKSALSEDLVIVEKGKVSFFSDPLAEDRNPAFFRARKAFATVGCHLFFSKMNSVLLQSGSRRLRVPFHTGGQVGCSQQAPRPAELGWPAPPSLAEGCSPPRHPGTRGPGGRPPSEAGVRQHGSGRPQSAPPRPHGVKHVSVFQNSEHQHILGFTGTEFSGRETHF